VKEWEPAGVQRCSTDCLIPFRRVTGLRAPYISANSRFLSSVSTPLDEFTAVV
jgi:hypothetical protein